MIVTGQFSEYVDQTHRLIMEEKADRQLWELWLHRVMDKPFSEFKDQLFRATADVEMSFNDKVTAINDSASLLSSFEPSNA